MADPCTFDADKNLSPCEGMRFMLGNDEGQGGPLRLNTLVNMKTTPWSRVGQVVVVHRSKSVRLYANYCPFCGGNISRAESSNG